jgi:hypothetical protein
VTSGVTILGEGMSFAKTDFERLILKLFDKKHEISLRDVAQVAGLLAESATDRRAIQRALTSLLKQGAIEVEGKARARRYILKDNAHEKAISFSVREQESTFQDMILSTEAIKLMQYVAQPIHTRKIVSYNQDLLKAYDPKSTAYLTPAIRKELLAVGVVENIERPAGTYARNILNRLLIDLSWNSSRLEGNTYSLLETKRLIELG